VPCVLRAFAVIQARIPEARLIVIGDGPERTRVHETAHALRLRNVEFVGAVPPTEMGRWYDEADVYLNASDIDNMPNSIIEAFACGLPVVTSRAGGIPFVVQHERNGLLVECGDHEGLAAATLRLLEEPALAQRLIAEGLRDVEQHYTWGAVSDGWAQLYRRLVSTRDVVPATPIEEDAATEAAALLPEASTQ